MKILVVGGSGFIGTRLVAILLERGHQVTNFDRDVSTVHPEITITGDVRSTAELTAASAGHDGVIDLATEHRDDVTPLSLYEEVNVGGAEALATTATGSPGLSSPAPSPSTASTRTTPPRMSYPSRSASTAARSSPPKAYSGSGRRKIRAARWPSRARPLYSREQPRQRLQPRPPGGAEAVRDGRQRGQPQVDVVRRQHRRIPRHVPGGTRRNDHHQLRPQARLTGRTFPVSAIRIRKFAADTTVNTDRLLASGYVPPTSLQQAIRRTIAAEFPSAAPHESEHQVS